MTQHVPSPLAEPYQAALEGWTSGPDDWPNTIAISVVTGWGGEPEPSATAESGSSDYADRHGEQQLVRVDTNYKDTRDSEYPVRLTRVAALELIRHLIEATADTFHYGRVGRLRATEAAELLNALEHVQGSLHELREHALQDLLIDAGIET